MAGNDYIYAKAKGTRAHNITIQAMWQLFLQQLIDSGGNVNDVVIARNCCLIRMLPEVGVGMNREGKKCKALRYINFTFTFTFT